MAVWSGASNEGLDYDLSSVDEIMASMEDADIMYARRTNGSWSTPQALANQPGKDESPYLAAGPNGEITAVWLNSKDDRYTLYAAQWNGSNWSDPNALADSVLMDRPAAIYAAASSRVIWAQDTDDNIDTQNDWRLYSSTWYGPFWSDPEGLLISADRCGPKPRTAAASHFRNMKRSIGLFTKPPEECCEDEDEPEPPDTPKDLQEVATSTRRVSRDPNEKIGIQGVGDLNYIEFGDRLRYTIYFENKADADVPAQEIFVTDCFDRGLDWTTLRVEEVAFGDTIVANPESSAMFAAKVTIPDYRTDRDKEWWVDIFTEFDYQTGCMKVTFRTLDPETGYLPEDVFAGLLPQEDGTGRGQGHIALSVTPRPDVDSGAAIENSASIVFDTNDPIVTNEVRHTARLSADVDGGRTLTLADAILALKVASGVIPTDVNIHADIDNDGQIGIEEALFVLRGVAEYGPW